MLPFSHVKQGILCSRNLNTDVLDEFPCSKENLLVYKYLNFNITLTLCFTS